MLKASGGIGNGNEKDDEVLRITMGLCTCGGVSEFWYVQGINMLGIQLRLA